jgi:hypothetical protein
MPFKTGSKVNLAKKIEKCEYEPITGSICDEIHEIIKKCFVFDPRARPSVFEILQS